MRSLPSDLLAKIKQSLQTIGNNSQPKTKITVARAKTTVTDSSYWTVEKIREKTGLGDIAVAPRRFHKHYGGPDRLYEIHVDTGEVKTAIREYPDLAKAGWQDQFSLGSGSDVAIAFDGDWEFYRKTWRLQTHEVPWIFWVDATGVLWGQLWDDETTKVELATQALRVSAIRAWKEVAGGSNDQGIVVTFIKTDGTLWYRNYCIQTDYTVVWEYEKTVTGFTGTAVNVNLFLTNDYRLGIVVENNTGNIWWLITGRTWSGMAIAPEKIAVGITDVTFEVIPITYYDTHSDVENIETAIQDIKFYVCPADTVPTIVETERLSFLDKKTIEVTFNYNLECDLVNLKTSLTLKNTVNQYWTVDEISQNGNILTITTIEEMSFAQDMILGYSAIGTYYLAFRISTTCLYDYGNIINLIIDGIPPIGFVEEQLAASITDIQFNVQQVYYTSIFNGGENLEAGIADISFVVTKVGSNPL